LFKIQFILIVNVIYDDFCQLFYVKWCKLIYVNILASPHVVRSVK
jgi:hypothetical protein